MKNKREEELKELIKDTPTLLPLISEMVYLEGQLDYLRKLPKIIIHPHNNQLQKTTPAARMYRDTLQQYLNLVRILLRATGTEIEDEESPLRTWINAQMNNDANSK